MKTFEEFIFEEMKLGSSERVHNSAQKSISLKDEYIQTIGYKPQGLWYGLGDSWIKWVELEMPEWKFDHYHKLMINEKKIIILKDKKTLEEFNEKYLVDKMKIDWSLVAKDYSGIELDPNKAPDKWNSTWDVISGCIWNKDAIKKIKLIK